MVFPHRPMTARAKAFARRVHESASYPGKFPPVWGNDHRDEAALWRELLDGLKQFRVRVGG